MAPDNMLGIPTGDFNRIYAVYDFPAIRPNAEDFAYSIYAPGSIEAFAHGQRIVPLEVDLSNRLTQATWCWIGLVYYKELGIPDDRDRVSPGPNGESIKYFPDFEPVHWFNHSMFCFFSSVFRSKIYSGGDNLGQLLNLMYDLRIERVDFHKAVWGLQALRPDLHADLLAIINSVAFQELKRLRHAETHNELPTGISGTVAEIPNGFSFGGGRYTKSEDIKNNSNAVLDSFGGTLEAIRKQTGIDMA